MRKLEKGQIIKFGLFPQDYEQIDIKKLSKGKGGIYEDRNNNKYLPLKYKVGPDNSLAVFKPLYWEVVKVEGDYAMLISVDILMSLKYSESTCVAYDISSVRKYLNKNFVELAFNNDELNEIIKVKIDGEKTTFFNDGMNDFDYAYVPSIEELCNIGAFKLYKETNKVCTALYGCGYNRSYLTRTSKSGGRIKRIALHYCSNDYEIREDWSNEIITGVAPAIWIKNNDKFK